MITGINHLTLAVRDLERSFDFYTRVVGLQPVVKWARGAYLHAGDDWICLSLDAETRTGPLPEYTHVAFSVGAEAFARCTNVIREQGVAIWKENRSEGDSLYFLDPDGHKLEIHTGDLQTRLAALRETPYEGLEWFIAAPRSE
ncbi:glutathione transferase [Halomonas desiderata]|mgnify:CR=1 FL=1|uniref:Glutathione transferase n=1 Tax=Billgrantia desiderata TaxID=52021 RepID=A0ABS9BAU0_9GAMM|nr:fosfomycin resistance glutathione transferase [Halomonas desiderata]MCE8044207.1 glutathione transferase [Halomonas desiderata]MCE8048781.1 glutathione transferase [Halomonas desiderata]NIC36479.1 glutathione transferase [Halomonas desiderata]